MDLKQRVLEHINNADDRLLKLIKALAESYEGEDHFYTVNEERYEELYREVDRRKKSCLKGESELLDLEQVKKNARNTYAMQQRSHG